MPKFVTAALGIQTTLAASSPADTTPPSVTAGPIIESIGSQTVSVSITATDTVAAQLTYFAYVHRSNTSPSYANLIAGTDGAGIALPAPPASVVANVGEEVRVLVQGLQPATSYPLAVAVWDGVNLVTLELGDILTKEAAPTLETIRQGGVCLYQDWLPFILPFVDGAPEAFVFQRLFVVAEDFLKFTRLWRQLYEIDVVAGQPGYTIPLPDNTLIAQLEDAPKIDNAPYGPIDEGVATRTAVARGYIREGANLFFQPVPSKTLPGGLKVFVSQYSSHQASSCPQFLFDDWREVITAGVLWDLKRMPSQPWSDPEGAKIYYAQYSGGRGRGAAEREGFGDGLPGRAQGLRVLKRRSYADHRTF